jgi:hypothetical protein
MTGDEAFQVLKAAKPVKFESKSQPGLFFWAENTDPQGILGGTPCFMVVFQVEGYPATEACDDWFGNELDAVALAKKFAEEGM